MCTFPSFRIFSTALEWEQVSKHSTRYPPEQHPPPVTTQWPRQENHTPIVFAVEDTRLSSLFRNEGRFAQMNPRTSSVSGGGANFMVAPNLRPTEKIMRGLAINAVHDMTATGIQPLPAVMGVLLAKSLMHLGPNPANMRSGWQVYIHSSCKGYPGGQQATVHPDLQARIRAAGLEHHMKSRCAEMALLLNYWHNNAAVLQTQPGKISLYGEKVYMLSYNTADFGDGTDARGRYIAPYRHEPRTSCKNRGDDHHGNCGCHDVLKLLRIELIGRGEPGEQNAAVWREQETYGNGGPASNQPPHSSDPGSSSAYASGETPTRQNQGGGGGWRRWGRGRRS